jgi:hypothetical protein
MRWLGRHLVCVLVLGTLASCAGRNRSSSGAASPATERQRQIARLQEFAHDKGFPETGNFRKAAPDKHAYYLCYYTGPWELPLDYHGLRYRERDQRGCGLSETKFDVYFHRVESVAGEDAPVTQALEDASPERALMVAAHEEAHEDPQLERLPAAFSEAATTLLGMITAAEFALRDGDTATATHLSADARLYARKSRAVNALHAALTTLYAEHRAGKRNRAETAARKHELLKEHAAACAAFGRGHSINPCLPVSNNAGVAFEHTYTRFYPLLYELYESTGQDLDRFLKALRALGNERTTDLAAVEARLRQQIRTHAVP